MSRALLTPDLCDMDFVIHTVFMCWCKHGCRLIMSYQPTRVAIGPWQLRYFVVGCLLLESIHGPLTAYFNLMQEKREWDGKTSGDYFSKFMNSTLFIYLQLPVRSSRRLLMALVHLSRPQRDWLWSLLNRSLQVTNQDKDHLKILLSFRSAPLLLCVPYCH